MFYPPMEATLENRVIVRIWYSGDKERRKFNHISLESHAGYLSLWPQRIQRQEEALLLVVPEEISLDQDQRRVGRPPDYVLCFYTLDVMAIKTAFDEQRLLEEGPLLLGTNQLIAAGSVPCSVIFTYTLLHLGGLKRLLKGNASREEHSFSFFSASEFISSAEKSERRLGKARGRDRLALLLEWLVEAKLEEIKRFPKTASSEFFQEDELPLDVLRRGISLPKVRNVNAPAVLERCEIAAEQGETWAQFYCLCLPLYRQCAGIQAPYLDKLVIWAEQPNSLGALAMLASRFLYTLGQPLGIMPDNERAEYWLSRLQNLAALILENLETVLTNLTLIQEEGFFRCLLGFFYESRLTAQEAFASRAASHYCQVANQTDLMSPLAMIARMALERIQPLIKDYRLYQLMAQRSQQQRQHRHYLLDDASLKQKILVLSEEDELDNLTMQPPEFSALLKKRLPTFITWATCARILVQQRAYDYGTVLAVLKEQSASALTQSQRKTFWKKFQTEHKVLAKWAKEKNLTDAQRAFLVGLTDYFAKIYKASQQASVVPVLIHFGGEKTRHLKADFIKRLMPPDEIAREIGQRGSHRVVELAGVHYKCTAGFVPIAPGVEYMVDRLNKLLVGHGSAPTALLKVTQGGRQFIYQASKTVVGAGLEHIFMHHPDYLTRLDVNNFSAMALLGMLTNPEDGKAENYMVEIENEAADLPRALHIVGVDNDMAFVPSVIRKSNSLAPQSPHYMSRVKCVLFLLPLMDQPLTEEFRAAFLARSPELVMIEWLYALYAQNQRYDALLAQQIFTPEDFAGDSRREDDKGLRLPIVLPQGLARTLYRKLVMLQQYVKRYPLATHHDLWAQVEPVLAAFYKVIRQKEKPVLDAYDEVDSIPVNELLADQLDEPREEGRTLKDYLLQQANSFRKMESSVVAAVEELLLDIDWSAFPPEQGGDVLLRTLRNVPLKAPTDLLHQLLNKQKLTPSLLSFLLEKGAHLGAVQEWDGCHSLHTAMRSVTEESLLTVIPWLLQAGADINAKDNAEETPLDKLLKRISPPREVIQQMVDSYGAGASAPYAAILEEILAPLNNIIILPQHEHNLEPINNVNIEEEEYENNEPEYNRQQFK